MVPGTQWAWHMRSCFQCFRTWVDGIAKSPFQSSWFWQRLHPTVYSVFGCYHSLSIHPGHRALHTVNMVLDSKFQKGWMRCGSCSPGRSGSCKQMQCTCPPKTIRCLCSGKGRENWSLQVNGETLSLLGSSILSKKPPWGVLERSLFSAVLLLHIAQEDPRHACYLFEPLPFHIFGWPLSFINIKSWINS